jgi:nuclear pore complex protein Nup188
MVPISTLGQVLNETKPAVIMWHHRYNCLSFLGKWLEQTTSARGATCGSTEEIVTEIIGLLADLISSADQLSRSNGVQSSAKRILEMASDGLDHYGDMISVVSDIFERYLHDIGGQPGPNRSLGPLISCVNFINALVKVIPGRVWPFLARSSLLASDGKGGMLASIISGVEASSGDFSFLLGAIRLFQSLVNDAATHAALRRTAGRISASSCHAADFTAGVPSYVIRDSLLSMLRTLVEVYNSNHSWRFRDPEQQLLINAELTAVSRDVIYYVYGISDEPDLAAKITGVLSSSAQYLLNVLRPASNAGLPFNPMLRIILNGIKTPMSTANLRQLLLKTRLVRSALCLAETLIQAGRLTKSPLSPLERQLFNASPILIRLFVLGTDYRLPVVTLLDLLISYASLESEQEPPSLLGYLGAKSSCGLLDVLSNFDSPFTDVSLRVAIWDLMATIVSKRQQWLAAYILTGSSPRDNLKSADKKDGPVMGQRPFLATSLDLLSSIDSTPLPVSAAALNFVAKAQEHWPPWVKPELRRHQHFFQKTVTYVAGLKLRGKPPADQCLNAKIAYLVADICTISLHSAKDDWDRTFFKTLIPLVAWFAENAVQVDGYNASLHANLKKNFGMKYPACDIFEIKRTSLERRPLGEHYFFDLGLGDKLFSYDFAWESAGKQGFREEMKRANSNLSLVETQVVSDSWAQFYICGLILICSPSGIT